MKSIQVENPEVGKCKCLLDNKQRAWQWQREGVRCLTVITNAAFSCRQGKGERAEIVLWLFLPLSRQRELDHMYQARCSSSFRLCKSNSKATAIMVIAMIRKWSRPNTILEKTVAAIPIRAGA